MSKTLILFYIGLISLPIIVLIIRKIIAIRTSRKLKFKLKLKLKKELKRQQELAAIDKANAESQKSDKLFMEKRKLKALKDTGFDLFYDEEKNLHHQRLEFKKKSKWKGIIYYANDKGDIYFISKEGNRIYIQNN